MSEPPPDKYVGWLNAVKGLTISNVVVIGLLLMLAIPAYTVWKTLNDPALLDRFMSRYEEVASQPIGCVIRHARERGGPDLWAIGTGFAYQGADRWSINVILDHKPSDEEAVSHCQTLKLLSPLLVRGNSDGDSAVAE